MDQLHFNKTQFVSKQLSLSTPCVDRDEVKGIATLYGLDGPVIESRCGRNFQQTTRDPDVLPAFCKMDNVPQYYVYTYIACLVTFIFR